MGFMGSVLGTTNRGGDQGGAGLNFNADGTQTQNPVTSDQATDAYNQTQTGLSQQQNFLSALQAQNGISNQNSVFGQQQALANQLQGVANGTGPNPAMAQLNQSTGQNIAAQSAMMASQRGAGANVGLMARQAAQQGAATQQAAVGQGASMQAQQSLNAMGQLQSQQANMGNMANTQVANQAGALSNYNQFAQGEQGNLLNAIAQQNNQAVQMQSSINSANSNVSAGVAGQQNKMGQSMLGMPAIGASGGEVKQGQIGNNPPARMAEGGAAIQPTQIQQPGVSTPPPSSVSSFMQAKMGMTPAPSPAAPGQTTVINNNNDQSQGNGLLKAGQNLYKAYQQWSPTTVAAPLNQVNSLGTKSQLSNPDDSAGGGQLAGGAGDSAGSAASASDASAADAAGAASDASALGDVAELANQGGVMGKRKNFDQGGSTGVSGGGLGSAIGAIIPLLAMCANQGGLAKKPKNFDQGGSASMLSGIMGRLSHGGEAKRPVPAIVSPGEVYIPPQNVNAAATAKDPRALGERIPGQAKVAGDSIKNDTVPKTLEEGGVVIKRTKAQDPDSARKFVQAIISKGRK